MNAGFDRAEPDVRKWYGPGGAGGLVGVQNHARRGQRHAGQGLAGLGPESGVDGEYARVGRVEPGAVVPGRGLPARTRGVGRYRPDVHDGLAPPASGVAGPLAVLGDGEVVRLHDVLGGGRGPVLGEAGEAADDHDPVALVGDGSGQGGAGAALQAELVEVPLADAVGRRVLRGGLEGPHGFDSFWFRSGYFSVCV